MSQSRSTVHPRALPKPVSELCAHLEERGIPSFSHGEGLLEDLRAEPRPSGGAALPGRPLVGAPRESTRSLLVDASREQVLRALPQAVVSAAFGERVTQVTTEGPVDLVLTGGTGTDDTLRRFGLGPYAFAFRPGDERWCDPYDRLPGWQRAELDLTTPQDAPFADAPRRYWIAARLIAEHDLQPTPALLECARSALPEATPRLPLAAPARRELVRILAAPQPGPALAFLHDVGVCEYAVPGASAVHAARIDALPPLPAIRWAAWLRGSATARAMVTFRVPHALARRIELLQASHPLDRSVSPRRDAALRKLLSRLEEDELSALFAWRRVEIASWPDREEAARVEARLAAIEARIAAIRAARSQSGAVRALALDGRAVMERLGAGPGPHVGRALAHLARFVAQSPDENVPEALERELLAWARQQTNLLDRASSTDPDDPDAA